MKVALIVCRLKMKLLMAGETDVTDTNTRPVFFY